MSQPLTNYCTSKYLFPEQSLFSRCMEELFYFPSMNGSVVAFNEDGDYSLENSPRSREHLVRDAGVIIGLALGTFVTLGLLIAREVSRKNLFQNVQLRRHEKSFREGDLCTVQRAEKEYWPELVEEMLDWKESSQEKISSSRENKRALEIFTGIAGLADLMAHNLETPFENRKWEWEDWDTVLTCQSPDGKVQAIALYDSLRHSIAYMITHPDNVHSSEVSNRFRGAGSAIVSYLIGISRITKRPLHLNATPSSEPFFLSQGFSYLTRQASSNPHQCVSMQFHP